MKYNCVNCGAPIDYELAKCPYCGTYYYDLSEMTVGEVAMLRVNIPGRGKVLARAVLKDINVTDEAQHSSVYGGRDGVVAQFLTARNISVGLNFETVPDNDGNLLTLIKEDK